MDSRLYHVSPDLCDRVNAASGEVCRRLAVVVARYALSDVGLDSPEAERALSLAETNPAKLQLERIGIEQQVAQLDEVQWNLQELVSKGRAAEADFLVAFSRARAMSAAAFALAPDPRQAALESLYEANAAIDDLSTLRALCQRVLESSSPEGSGE